MGFRGKPKTRSQGKLKVREKLFDQKKIDRLDVSLKKGVTRDAAVFDTLAVLRVKETIKIQGDYFLAGSGSSVSHSFTVRTPEPTTILMLAAGLAGLAAAGRRRAR